MKKILLLVLAVFAFSGCVNKDDAEKALANQGFTNVRVTGYNLFACSKDDFYHTGFTATNIQGNTVSGTVCSGLIFKGSTIRW